MPPRAFTLVEILVSIGVIALLLGLLLPTLSGARLAASETKALAQLRDLGLTMEMYLQTYANAYPWHEPGVPFRYDLPGEPSGLLTSSDDPWSMRYLWASTMHQVAPWPEHYVSWLGARGPDAATVPWENSEGLSAYPAYFYSNSFIGDPACWLATGQPRARPVRAHSVRFPSGKALMYDIARNYLPIAYQDRTTRAVLAADGSASMRDDRDAARPVQNRLRPNMSAQIYQDTPGGVFGRDF
jgi:prepilin-type N-terminal cleavage/methylation domain-containing protein